MTQKRKGKKPEGEKTGGKRGTRKTTSTSLTKRSENKMKGGGKTVNREDTRQLFVKDEGNCLRK